MSTQRIRTEHSEDAATAMMGHTRLHYTRRQTLSGQSDHQRAEHHRAGVAHDRHHVIEEHADRMTSAIGGEDVVGKLYKAPWISGRAHHASDCSSSKAYRHDLRRSRVHLLQVSNQLLQLQHKLIALRCLGLQAHHPHKRPQSAHSRSRSINRDTQSALTLPFSVTVE